MNSIRSRIQNQTQEIRHQRRIRAAVRAFEPSEFYRQIDPPTPGDYAIGLSLVNDTLFEANKIQNLNSNSVWDYLYPSEYFVERMHAFDWMDDLAAVKSHEADRKIRAWANDWIERYGRGDGMGWRLDLMGWRVLRLITHSQIILSETDIVARERYFESLSIQVHYLRDCIPKGLDGVSRIVALVAWLYAALSLEQFRDDLDEAIAELDNECGALCEGDTIHLSSRNPEELSQIFCLLVWSDLALEDFDRLSGRYHNAAIDTMGKALRALRFGDRMILPANGGGSGRATEIERALSVAQIQGATYDNNILGFRQIRATALTVFFDCMPPPSGPHHETAHASTLGLWVAERKQVLFGSGGSPIMQPLVKRIELQETNAHSTVVLNDRSSSQLSLKKDISGKYTIGATIARPAQVLDFDYSEDTQAINVEATHDGYREDFGYVHTRKLLVDRDGLYFGGIDIIQAQNAKDEKRIKSLVGAGGRNGVPVDILFHLGPKIEPRFDENHEAVSFRSDAGNLWVFRQEGGKIEIFENDYYYADRIGAVPNKSIAIRTRLVGNSGYVTWSFQAYPDP